MNEENSIGEIKSRRGNKILSLIKEAKIDYITQTHKLEKSLYVFYI